MENLIKCLHGKYSDNTFYPDEGKEFFCISYHSLNREINGTVGFFNMRYLDENNVWCIFQYLLDEEIAM